jgi:hypothetical protein
MSTRSLTRYLLMLFAKLFESFERARRDKLLRPGGHTVRKPNVYSDIVSIDMTNADHTEYKLERRGRPHSGMESFALERSI